MRELSSLANWFLLLYGDMGQVIDSAPCPQNRDGVERAYALVFRRELIASGYTPSTFLKAMEKATTPAWVRRSGLCELMEMASPESCHSPLHEPSSCKECRREMVKPFDQDDPWGHIARTEMLAEITPSERNAFLGR